MSDNPRVARLLDVLRTEVWPFLKDPTPISNQDAERYLGDDPCGPVRTPADEGR